MPDQAPSNLVPASTSHLEEVRSLSQDLKKLLAGCDAARLKSEVRDEIDQLSNWTDAYLAGLEAASRISETAGTTLAEARKELDLAYQQFLVLEDEGGNVANPQQQRQTEALSKALRRVNSLIPAMTAVMADPSRTEPDIQPPEQEPGVPPEISPPSENPSEPSGPPDAPAIPPVIDPKM